LTHSSKALHYQPIVDLGRGVVAGYEALARFPEEIGLGPDRCLAYAEVLGRRLELETVLARKAMRLRDELPQNCFLSVNVSPGLLLSESWQRLTEATGSLAGLVIEITEGDVVRDYAAMRKQVGQIRRAGGLLAVDDTGAGYASLKHVMELRPNFIKLDRLFVSGCSEEPAKRAMIELLGDAADRLDAWVVAEGIETQAELDELFRLDVPLGQGHFLGHAEPEMLPLREGPAMAMENRRNTIVSTASVYRHTESCMAAESAESAAEMLVAQPQLGAVMVVDQWGRPMELMERHPLLGVRAIPSLMRVQASSEPQEVLSRALTRTSAECFDAIAAVNEQGRFQGVVRIERLMRAVLDVSEAAVGSRARVYSAA
jgi:EAL domain-containing protein (putative c-di-GMP-specific phosphodiesterase class I)